MYIVVYLMVLWTYYFTHHFRREQLLKTTFQIWNIVIFNTNNSVCYTVHLGTDWRCQAVNQRMTDNTMDKKKRTEGKTMIYKTIHRKLQLEQHEPHLKPRENKFVPEGLAVHSPPIVFLFKIPCLWSEMTWYYLRFTCFCSEITWYWLKFTCLWETVTWLCQTFTCLSNEVILYPLKFPWFL